MSKEAMKEALELVRAWERGCDSNDYWWDIEGAVKALEEALAQPAREFIRLTPQDYAGLRSRADPQQVNDFVFSDIVAMTEAKLREINE